MRTPSGLPNLGNSCFMNVIIQSLGSVPVFVRTVMANFSDDTVVMHLLAQMFKKMDQPLLKMDDMKNFRDICGLLKCNYSTSRQQDCCEFLDFILTNVKEEFLACSDASCSLFEGQLLSSLSCACCQKETIHHESFSILRLALGNGSPKYRSLEGLFAQFRERTEILEYFCERCDRPGKGYMECRVDRAPEVLFIQVQRFTNKMEKLTSHISFPLRELNMGELMTKRESRMYDLAAVVFHEGPFSHGHYLATVKRGDKWFCCEDKKVTQISENFVKEVQAYLLVYVAQDIQDKMNSSGAAEATMKDDMGPASVESVVFSHSPTTLHKSKMRTYSSLDNICSLMKGSTCESCGLSGHEFRLSRSLGCIPDSYSRYSVCDWEHAYNANYTTAERERNSSEHLQSDAWCTGQTADKEIRDKQCTSTKKLGERVYEVAFWKEQILAEIRAMETECDNLQEHAQVLEETLFETKLPLLMIKECLRQREKRLGIECVHDEVKRGLCQEVEIIRKIRARIKEFITKANCQLKKNRVIQHNCDLDVRDKHHAQGIDDRSHQLRNSSCKIGIENVDETSRATTALIAIARAQLGLEVSEKLRREIDCFLRSATKEMWMQFNQVNSAFNAHIQEITDAKSHVEIQLESMNSEIHELDHFIQLRTKVIRYQELTLKMAQMQLEERSQLRRIELRQYEPVVGIQQEVHDLHETVRRLKENLRKAENRMCLLLKTRAMLEQDIAIKETTIQIDSAFCLGLRKKMPVDPKIGPVVIMPHVQC